MNFNVEEYPCGYNIAIYVFVQIHVCSYVFSNVKIKKKTIIVDDLFL